MHEKKNKQQRGWIVSAAIGSLIAMILTFLLIALLGMLMLREKVGEGNGEAIICGMQLLSAFIGAELSKHVSGFNDIRSPSVAVGMYAAMTVLGGMLLDGSFQKVWVHILAIGIGYLASCALCIRQTRRTRKRKKGVW